MVIRVSPLIQSVNLLVRLREEFAIRPHDFVNFSKSEAAVNPDIP